MLFSRGWFLGAWGQVGQRIQRIKKDFVVLVIIITISVSCFVARCLHSQLDLVNLVHDIVVVSWLWPEQGLAGVKNVFFFIEIHYPQLLLALITANR